MLSGTEAQKRWGDPAPPGSRGFFHVAKPAVSSCGGDATHVDICIDYGGLDVLFVKLAVRGTVWVPHVMSWHQRGRR